MKPLLLDAAAWRGYRRPAFPAECWAIEEGVLRALPAANPVSLVSRETFGDFELELEWRLGAGGNSGVLYRVSEEAEAPWQSGPELQLLDDRGHPDGRVAETRCGAMYGLYPPSVPLHCEPGQFHEARVRIHDSRVEHWIDDVLVVRADLDGVGTRARIAGSKFARFPRFAREPRGHLVLQHHGEEVRFRNVRVA